ncbi:MAG: amidohydrolase family protein [Gemmataceae bacterium]|nr:amidohydrolase family protein [Gemmataceae bacterium]
MCRTFSSSWRLRVLGLLGLLLLAAESPAQDQLAIKGGRIIPIAGQPMEAGIILIRDGRIQSVGRDLTIPSDYRVIDATGKVVLPGFIEAHSARGMDRANERNDNVPFLSVLDAIDPGQDYFEDCRRNGVTSVAIVPGDDTMIGGQAAVIKTAGTFVDQMIVKRQAGIKLSLRPLAGRSRMSHLATLRRELDTARDFLQEEQEKAKVATTSSAGQAKTDPNGSKAPEAEQPQPPPAREAQPGTPEAQPVDTTLRREALLRLLKGEMPAFIYCDAAMDVPQALKLIQEYRLRAILVLGQNCYKAAKQLATSKLPVILNPTLVFWETDPRTGEDRKIVLPKIYREAGVPVTFQVTGIAGGSLFAPPGLPATLGTNYLWYQAATAVKYGTPVAEALEAITLRPARWLGVDGLAGSIEPGKDADLVILTGDPLKLNTWVETTLVRGKVVYERDKDRKLQHLLRPSKETVTSR